MNTGSKILFIEDQLSNDNMIIDALEEAEILDEDNQIESIEDLHKTKGCITVATTFEEAVNCVEEVGNGSDYEWIFIDRNLSEYKTVKDALQMQDYEIEICNKKFTSKFFQSYQYGKESEQVFLGDYLYVMLITAGVPIEKICFLTANEDISLEKLKKSPYLRRNRFPAVITKDRGKNDLIKKLKEASGAKIRYLHKDIFENSFLQKNFDLDQYIELLKKFETDEEFNEGDGTTLRNMIEEVIRCCRNSLGSPDSDKPKKDYISVRSVLNEKRCCYNLKIPEGIKEIHNYFMGAFRAYHHIPTEKDRGELENHYLENQKKSKEESETLADEVIKYANNNFWETVYSFYYNNSSPEGLPPKYIYSYIDNIYTVTSECSAHGANSNKTKGLSKEGWKALVYGMCQILQWVAEKHPNEEEKR